MPTYRSLKFGNLRIGRIETLQRFKAQNEIFLAYFSENKLPCGAVNKPYSKMLLKLLQMVASQRPRYAKVLGSIREALRPGDLNKCTDTFQPIHRYFLNLKFLIYL